MTTYRVPIHLRDAPGEAAEPSFQDAKDFWEALRDALGVFGRVHANIASGRSGDAVQGGAHELHHNAYVVVPEPGMVAPSVAASGEDAAALVVRRALDQIGYDEESARVDRAGVLELEDPLGS
jgi:hypothetical protein